MSMSPEQIAIWGHALHSVIVKTAKEKGMSSEDAIIMTASALGQFASDTHGPLGAVEFLRDMADIIERDCFEVAFSTKSLQ